MDKILLPKNFTFGIAESDLQTVGSANPVIYENSKRTMWDLFSEKVGIDSPLNPTFKYENYKDDVKLISDLNVKSYRTSISMTRTIDKNGQENKIAIKWYRDYFKQIKKSGLKLHLCLYHWEAPEQFISEGILDKNFEEYFLKHVDIVINNFSDLVDYFIPMNELWCINFLSYFIGIHAPGIKDINKFFQAYFKSIELQTKVINLIKKKNKNNKIGIVNIHFPTYIELDKVDNSEYLFIRELADNLTNYIYSDPFYRGSIHEIITRYFKEKLPKDYKSILLNAKLGEQIDYYGINYYGSQYVRPNKNSNIGYEQLIPNGAKTNDLGWPIALPPFYPEGLVDILDSIDKKYTSYGLKKIIITENGIPMKNKKIKNEINDEFRINFIKEHLKQVQKAVSKGIKVEGYFLWSLVDNYEWQDAYKDEGSFGLMAIDRKTGKRFPKKSYFWLKDFLKNIYKNG